MLDIEGQVTATVTISGLEFPLSVGDFEDILISEHIQTNLPACRIKLTDRIANLCNNSTINDGSLLTIDLSQNNEILKSIDFRVTGVPKQLQHAGGLGYEIYGIYDALPYVSSTFYGAVKGNSSDVMKQIAEHLDLETNIDTTNDNQTWLSTRKSFCHYARTVCDHGWVDEESCMILCVSTDGYLNYKDINKIAKTNDPSLPYYYYGPEPESDQKLPRRIYVYRSNVNSGVSNHSYGYNSTMTEQLLSGLNNNHSSVTLEKTLSNHIEMNNDIKQMIGNVRDEYLSPNTGNTHINYSKALYQNKRFKSLYSTSIKALINLYSGEELLDIVNLDVNDPAQDSSNKVRSGKYIVAAKSTMIKGTQFYEKFLFITTGPNSTTQPML